MSRAEKIRASFRAQARACRDLGSPFTAGLLGLLAQRLDAETTVGARVLSWAGAPSAAGDALALRLAGGLHALVLSGRDPALAAAYPPAGFDADRLSPLLDAALHTHADLLHRWLDSPPQTNEVRRSAPLIAAARLLSDRFALPLVLSELGASAGLNLLWDHYALQIGPHRFGPAQPAVSFIPDWQGPPPPQAPLTIAERAGVDLTPLDPVADRLPLLSYLWPDQAGRLARTRAALDLATRLRPRVDPGDAADWLDARLARQFPGHLHIVFHTIAAQYFPQETRDRIAATLARAGEIATTEAALAHLWLEADGQSPGATLGLTLWPGGEPHPLGRADFHGRWVDWRPGI